jgi:hypothetical protein
MAGKKWPGWNDLPGWDSLPTWGELADNANNQIDFQIETLSVRASWSAADMSDKEIANEAMRRLMEKRNGK